MSAKERNLPTHRISRFSKFASLATRVAGSVITEGTKQLAQGNRPKAKDLVLTPQNIARLTDQLAHLRGAAMKLGQMLSMDAGEVYLKSLRLERFQEKGQQLSPEVERLLKPAVSMIGFALSQSPVYKLDSNKVQESLIKSSEPNLVIKDNKLVIELFD